MGGMRFSLAVPVCVLFVAGCAARAPLPSKAIALNDDGARAIAEGDLTTAEARLGVAVEYNPRFTEAWVNLGMVALARGDLDLAEKDLRRARELNEDLPAPHHGLGLLAEKRGDLPSAERAYRAALRVDPGFAAARANLGRLLFSRGAYAEAREQFQRLTEVAPAEVAGYVGLCESLLRLGRVAESDDVLALALSRLGDDPAFGLLVGRQALRRGDLDRAEAAFVPRTAEGNDRAQAWAWVGITRMCRGDRAGAEEALAESKRLAGGDAIGEVLERALASNAAAETPSLREAR